MFLRNASADALKLKLIDERLGKEKTRAIEKKIIRENMERMPGRKEQAIQLVKKFFPHFPDSEIEKLYEQPQDIEPGS